MSFDHINEEKELFKDNIYHPPRDYMGSFRISTHFFMTYLHCVHTNRIHCH